MHKKYIFQFKGNEKIKGISNENDPGVKILISQVIKKCKARGKYIGL